MVNTKKNMAKTSHADNLKINAINQSKAIRIQRIKKEKKNRKRHARHVFAFACELYHERKIYMSLNLNVNKYKLADI